MCQGTTHRGDPKVMLWRPKLSLLEEIPTNQGLKDGPQTFWTWDPFSLLGVTEDPEEVLSVLTLLEFKKGNCYKHSLQKHIPTSHQSSKIITWHVTFKKKPLYTHENQSEKEYSTIMKIVLTLQILWKDSGDT